MKKKGFTLIELLAVIVILAIIALITVPVVINIINSAKKGSAEDSTYGVIEAAKLHWISNQGNTGFEQENSTIVFKYTNGEWKTGSQTLEISGTKPTGDSESSITITNGNITVNSIKFGDYYCSTNNDGKAVCSKEKTSGSSTTVTTSGPTKVTVAGSTHKGIVYLNPKDLSVECNESNSQIGTGTPNPSGCMKFYIFNDSGATYKMILDHNTTATVAWNSEATNSEMKEVAEQLIIDTQDWVGSPRLITAQELADATNTPTFDGSSGTNFWFNGSGTNKQTRVSTTKGDNEYAWLFDYTYNCLSYGCNVDINEGLTNVGYWTSTPVSDSTINAWSVGSSGALVSSSYVVFNNYFGVRPVIELNKSLIN